ncbi:MAG: trypsin-like peptidase domain-containing protein [Planctomycetota bacterium]
MRKLVSVAPVLVVCVAMVAAAVFAPQIVRRVLVERTRADIVLARQALETDNILERIDRAVRRVAEIVHPSVVHIEVTVRFNGENQRFAAGSSGSGWVYDADGHIITNAHVVGAADTVQVEFSNGRAVTGTVVDADTFTDIAVIKVEPGPGVIPILRGEASERVSMGDRVFAFGSPFNFKFSMSEGIVSGLGRNPRTGSGGSSFTNYIQTDAAVNPGNSGGPLVNVRGSLIGMNVAIATGRDSDSRNDRQGQSAGISFAIPLGVIESVVDQIITSGEVRRGFLGISGGRFSQNAVPVLDQDGNFVRRGVYVQSVTDGLAADRAGMLPGDVITMIDNNEIREWHHLRSVITTARPGAMLPIEVWRDGEPVELQVSLAEFPDEILYGESITSAVRSAGMGLAFGRRDDGSPVVVIEWLDPRRSAGRAGFTTGDEIVAVEGNAVGSVEQFYSELADADALRGRPVELTVDRNGDLETLRLRLSP